MVEAFNWLGQQVRLGQAVKFPVECLHPRVSVDSHTGLLVNYLEVMSGLEQFTICSCKMCGLCLFFFFIELFSAVGSVSISFSSRLYCTHHPTCY